VRFYHLELNASGEVPPVSVLLGDRAGEEYRDAGNDISVVSGFTEIARADSLTILVDGARLADVGARHNHRSEILGILQGLHDADALQRGLQLALVLTKLDVVEACADPARVERDFTSLVADVSRLFGAVLGGVQSFRVAASPKTDRTVRGTGISDVVTFWLTSKNPPIVSAFVPTKPSTRVFAQLTVSDAEAPEVA
jgi:hypothetical protein